MYILCEFIDFLCKSCRLRIRERRRFRIAPLEIPFFCLFFSPGFRLSGDVRGFLAQTSLVICEDVLHHGISPSHQSLSVEISRVISISAFPQQRRQKIPRSIWTSRQGNRLFSCSLLLRGKRKPKTKLPALHTRRLLKGKGQLLLD